MHIDRHKIDEPFLKEIHEIAEPQFGRLPSFVRSAETNPGNLSLLISNAWEAAGFGLIVGAARERILDALKLAGRASAALFAAKEASASNPVTVRLEQDKPTTYTSPPNESTVHSGRWINGYYLAQICRDRYALDLICQADPTSLHSSTTGPRYVDLYAKSLRDFHTRQLGDIVNTMMTAMKATDTERPDSDISDDEWALDLHVPELETLIYVVTRDPKFGDSLRRAVELHKKFWSKKKEYRLRSYRGFFSLPLTGLARMGLDQGLSFEFESAYLPRELLDNVRA